MTVYYDEKNYLDLKEILSHGQNMVFFGGAGVSTASGIPDFRSATGLYHQQRDLPHSPEYYMSHDYLEDDPEGFSDYMRELYKMNDAQPNGAHYALAELEKQGRLKAVITQNIDGLHQKAGSKNVLEIHGNVRDFHCARCGKDYSKESYLAEKGASRCECGGLVRPPIVLYGEMLPTGVFDAAIEAIHQADIFIVGGSSLVVYPAAGLLNYYRGDKLILMNMERTGRDSRADYIMQGDISKTLPLIAGLEK